MNVYQKLNEARAKFHKKALKKSGHNKFAGYNYFELGDFVIPAIEIFNEVGLTSIVRFGKEIAEFIVVNVEKPDEIIVFTSPMSSAALKGCHEVQNLGAVQTYLTRYLWVSVLHIVEHDALDATTGSKVVEEEGTPDEGRMLDYIAAIEATTSLEQLKDIYIEAFAATDGNKAWQTKMIAAKDAKKKGLK
jgi:hypothetical protein